MTLDKVTAKDFASSGYLVRPASNGGFTAEITSRDGGFIQGRFSSEFASFTNSRDLLAFLSEGHEDYDRELAV